MIRLENELPLQDSLESIQALLEGLHCRPVGQPDEVVTGTVEEVPSLRRIQIEEDAGNDLKDRELESIDVFYQARCKWSLLPMTFSSKHF